MCIRDRHKIGVLGPGDVKNEKYENTVEYKIKGNFNASNNFTCIYVLLKMFGPWGSINWWNWRRGDVKNGKYENTARGVSN